MNALISIASIAVVLGILVFVHEFGHYAVAKLCGVRVEVFSIGFGKRLWGFRRGDTDYRFSALPFGGYVKMAGENPLEDRTGDPGEFTSHPRWQRFLIAIAGPTMNIILAVAALTVVFMYHYERQIFLDQPAVIGMVVDGSPAQQAGFQTGDRIVRIQNINNPTWEDVLFRGWLNAKESIAVDVQRGNDILHKSVTPRATRDEMGEVGWLPQGHSIVTKVDVGLPAAKAGLQPGDELLTVNNIPVNTGNAAGLGLVLKKNNDKPIQLAALRQGQPMEFTLTPVYTDDSEHPGEKRYRIGVAVPDETRVYKLPFPAAANLSVTQCWKKSGLVFELLGKMFKRPAIVKSFSSPIGMAKFAGDAMREEGWAPKVTFLAVVSLQLALFNLLPIPILDGGLMLMLLIEGIIRRDIKQEVKERVYQVAFVFLMLFAAVVIYNDVVKQFHGG
jgi:regulator of sigma E protease